MATGAPPLPAILVAAVPLVESPRSLGSVGALDQMLDGGARHFVRLLDGATDQSGHTACVPAPNDHGAAAVTAEDDPSPKKVCCFRDPGGYDAGMLWYDHYPCPSLGDPLYLSWDALRLTVYWKLWNTQS